MDRDAIALFREVADRSPSEREAYYACHQISPALRAEVESLLEYDRDTLDAIHGRVASAAARALLADAYPTTTDAKDEDASELRSDTGEGRFLAGTLLGGRYRIVSLLGRGGMGEVYRAIDLKLKQPVALKFLPHEMTRDGRLLARFHGEVRLARQISHPNVCRVYDIGEVDGVPYISMEYIDGEDLASLLRRIGRLPHDKALDIARRLCAGLAAAHDKGVIHRDLKPANVMIDRRGQARITDFGLAASQRELREVEARSGTPAYMAPEQLQGQGVSVRCDIYSLGLVLYEMFSGRRPFDRARRPADRPPSITSVTRDIDPAVARAIDRCLEPDPRDRPASALSVAAMLPGANRLAEALAAGVTPSPQMVAASDEGAAISPRTALITFAVVLAGLTAVLVISPRVNLLHVSPVENSPEVLAQKARELIAAFGYKTTAVDHASGFLLGGNFQRYAERNEPRSEYLAQLALGRPALITFYYRHSQAYLVPRNAGLAVQSWIDPPLVNPGDVFVWLLPHGELWSLQAVPPVEDYANQQTRPGNWDALFAAAGLDPSRFTRATPQWIPPVTFDDRAAWTGTSPHAPSVPLRVEAASWKGRPVYFRVIGPWTVLGDTSGRLTRAEVVGFSIYVLWIAIVVSGAAFIAHRNHRLGRSDVKGAQRLGAVMLVCSFGYWVLTAHHVPSLTYAFRAFDNLGGPVLAGGVAWVLYLAVEPYVRRYWPQSLISWTRILSARIRDPLVGAHVLIGTAFGVGLAFWYAVRAWVMLQHGALPIQMRIDYAILQGAASVMSAWLENVIAATTEGLGSVALFLLLRAVLRRGWPAGAGYILLYSAPFILMSTRPFTDAAFLMPIAAVYLWVLIRFGVLCMTMTSFVSAILTRFPMTTDLSAWYSGATVFALAMVAGLAIWSFRAALAGRPLFGDELLEPAE